MQNRACVFLLFKFLCVSHCPSARVETITLQRNSEERERTHRQMKPQLNKRNLELKFFENGQAQVALSKAIDVGSDTSIDISRTSSLKASSPFRQNVQTLQGSATKIELCLCLYQQPNQNTLRCLIKKKKLPREATLHGMLA